jgi:hypothetical protein
MERLRAQIVLMSGYISTDDLEAAAGWPLDAADSKEPVVTHGLL